jgi:glutathione S-transferase
MKLYMHPVSMTSRPVRLFVADQMISVDEEIVDILSGEHLKEPYILLNPNGLVPMLEDGNVRITESATILRYLADRIGSTAYPHDLRHRAKVNEIMDWLNTQFYRDWGYGLCYPQIFPNHKRRSAEAHDGAIEWGLQNSRKWMQVLNDHWIGPEKGYLCGQRITIADYFGSGLVTVGEIIGVNFKKYPNVNRWLENMKALPSWPKVNDAFYGFVDAVKDQQFRTL